MKKLIRQYEPNPPLPPGEGRGEGASRTRFPFPPRSRFPLPLIVLSVALLGCHTDMYDQPRYEALEKSDFFKDGRASRPLVAGTVQYQAPPADDVMHTGKQNGQLATELPVTLTPALLERGHERFNIYCSVCHGRTGTGDGMIVQRGYRQPPTFHSDRLRGAPVGHFFDVMTNGFGAMPSYSLQVPVEDRWAIAAYIRALQLSQYAAVDQIPDDVKQQLKSTQTTDHPDARE